MPQTVRADHFATLQDGRALVRMLCEVEPVESDGGTWIQVLPFGPFVVARDGRAFSVSDAQGVLSQSTSELPLLVDWEHKSEYGDTRAAGWIEELAVETGAEKRFPRAGLWGRAHWTEAGAKDVASRAYRFLSPVVVLSKETRDAQFIASVALTNRPALAMAGINDAFRERLSARFGPLSKENAMNEETKRELCGALGLKPDAADAEILAAAKAPKADSTLQEMCSRLTKDLADEKSKRAELEQKLAEHARASFAAQIDSTLAEAAKAGKLVPAQVEHWREFCSRSPEAFEMFSKQVLPHLPKVGEPAPRSPEKTPEAAPATAVKSLFGFSSEQLEKAREYLAQQRAAFTADEGED